MAQLKTKQVQYPMVWSNTLGFADLADNTLVVDLPPSFVLTDIGFRVDEAFNGTTPALSAVDNKSAPTTLVTSAAITAANAILPMVPATKWSYYPSGGKITFQPSGGAGATAGSGRAFVEGIAMGRQNEVVGTLAAT